MILNRRTHRPQPGEIYIGRPSKWGNPFKMRGEQDRIRVITQYRDRLVHRLRTGSLTRAELADLHGHPLTCWCAPRACHGDPLEAAARWAATEPGVALADAAWTTDPIPLIVARRLAGAAAANPNTPRRP